MNKRKDVDKSQYIIHGNYWSKRPRPNAKYQMRSAGFNLLKTSVPFLWLRGTRMDGHGLIHCYGEEHSQDKAARLLWPPMMLRSLMLAARVKTSCHMVENASSWLLTDRQSQWSSSSRIGGPALGLGQLPPDELSAKSGSDWSLVGGRSFLITQTSSVKPCAWGIVRDIDYPPSTSCDMVLMVSYIKKT